jgi:hypothetical protein
MTLYSSVTEFKELSRPIYDSLADHIAESFNYIKDDAFYNAFDEVLLRSINVGLRVDKRDILESWIIWEMGE